MPSGLKWADKNVGASKPEEIGLYFAWGETEGYTGITDDKKFNWGDYKYCNGSSTTMIKYCDNSSYGADGFTDNLTVLEQMDDAAYQSDNTCRMPTYDEFKELLDYTDGRFEMLNDTYNGIRLTSNINGNSIFIPPCGHIFNGLLKEEKYVKLWSNTIDSDNHGSCKCLLQYGSMLDIFWLSRCIGLPIRAVKL